jgi:DNA-binding transcriptional ArsR family regulator
VVLADEVVEAMRWLVRTCDVIAIEEATISDRREHGFSTGWYEGQLDVARRTQSHAIRRLRDLGIVLTLGERKEGEASDG